MAADEQSVESLQWHFLQDQKQYANDVPDDDDEWRQKAIYQSERQSYHKTQSISADEWTLVFGAADIQPV